MAQKQPLVLTLEKVVPLVGLTTPQTYSTVKSSTTMPTLLEILISIQDSKWIDTQKCPCAHSFQKPN